MCSSLWVQNGLKMQFLKIKTENGPKWLKMVGPNVQFLKMETENTKIAENSSK